MHDYITGESIASKSHIYVVVTDTNLCIPHYALEGRGSCRVLGCISIITFLVVS